MGPEKGTSCAGSEKWAWVYEPWSLCNLQQVTTSSTGITVLEFLRELYHENKCVDLSKKGSGY